MEFRVGAMTDGCRGTLMSAAAAAAAVAPSQSYEQAM